MGSDLLVKTVDPGDFVDWFRFVSGFFANFLAIDTTLGLKGTGVEYKYTVPANSYTELAGYVHDALVEVAHAVSNKSPLPFAFPKVIVDLMAHQLFSPVTDDRGVIKIDPVLPPIVPIDDDGMKVVKALFGVDGYYASSRGLRIVESAGYLGSGGEYLRPTYVTAKSKQFRSEAQSLAPSTKLAKFSSSQKLIRVVSGKNVTSLKADGNFIDDVTGLAYLFPSLHLDAGAVAQIAGRLVQSVHPCEDEPEGVSITAARFVQWFYSCDQRGGPALRGFLLLQPNYGLNFDMQRSVLKALEIHNKRDVTSVLPDAPNASLLMKQLGACLIQYNPTTVILNREEHWDALNNLANINKDLLVTLPVAESLRAHKCGMLPFSTSTSRYTGLTQTLLDHYYKAPSDVGSLLIEDTHASPFDLDFVAFDDVSDQYVRTAFADETELYSALRTNTTLCRDFLIAFGGELQLSPALSYDLNRQPISPAYAIGKIHDNSDRTSGIPLPFGSDTTPDQVESENLLRYIARFDVLADAMNFLPPLVFGAMPGKSELVDLHETAVEAMVKYNELTLASFNLTLKSGTQNVTDPIILSNGYLDHLEFVLAQVFNINKGQDSFMEILTKIDDLEASRAAFLFTDMMYYPIVYTYSNSSFSSDEQRLVLLGYHGTQTLTINKYHSIATTAQIVDGKFATLAGDFLSKVGKAGGFGLGEILGPVIQGITAPLGSIIGGDAANIVGGVLGAATSFLPFF